jgi:voltage-gated potassium channel
VTAILDHTLFGQANLNVTELQIPFGSPFIGRLVSVLELETRYNLILLGMVDRKMEEYFVYSQRLKNTRLQAGDILVVIGSVDASASLKQDLLRERS